MSRGRTRRLLGAVAFGAASAAAGSLGVGPAAADCVRAEASYTVLSGPETYVIPAGTCVTPTPFEECVTDHPRVGEPGTVEAHLGVALVCPD